MTFSFCVLQHGYSLVSSDFPGLMEFLIIYEIKSLLCHCSPQKQERGYLTEIMSLTFLYNYMYTISMVIVEINSACYSICYKWHLLVQRLIYRTF